LNAAVQDVAPTEEQNRALHRTIQGVTQDLDKMAFNTAIAKLMECTNFFTKQDVRPIAAMRTLVLLLSPMAPHIAEELWQLLGGKDTLAYEPWPEHDPELVRSSTIELPVQVNGKLRGKIVVPADASQADALAAARADEKVAPYLEGRTIVKEVVVPGRLVNFVVK
jgi:leucyl-tRNA synthetase